MFILLTSSQWGAGSRECIGRHIALMEIFRTLALIVPRYSFEMDDEDVSWKNFQFTTFTRMKAVVGNAVE
jgi:cytochrome P450